MNLFVQNVCVIILIIRNSPIHYKIQSLHLYASNHTNFNVLCTYECFIVYLMVIKINLIQTSICYDPAKCVQPVKWVNHIIRKTLQQFEMYIIIFIIIHILPMYLYIMNLMKSISLMYKHPGCDGIPVILAKRVMHFYVNPLTHIINQAFKDGVSLRNLNWLK